VVRPAGGRSRDETHPPVDSPSMDRGRDSGIPPLVSLLVAMRNEGESIEACLRSIIEQTYPADRLEILVFDGASDDSSMAIARRVLDGRPLAEVLTNPKRTQAAAWNLGIEAACGDILGIVSGHAELGPEYVAAAVETLRRTGADMVGGPVRAVARGAVAEAIALAVSTPFGVGGARFRYLETEAEVDTVFMGLASRDLYRRFRFDEEMVRNQDDELSYRLLDAGARIVCNPAIQSSYRARSTIAGLWRQYFEYGFWKVRVLQKHPAQTRPRHLVPAALVSGVAASVVAAAVVRPLAVAPMLLVLSYATANLAAMVTAGRGRAPRTRLLMATVFPVLHVAYGSGFLWGLLRHRAWTAGSIRSVIAALLGRRSGRARASGPGV